MQTNRVPQVILFAATLLPGGLLLAAAPNLALDPFEAMLSQGHELFAARQFDAARAQYARILTLTNAAPALCSLVQLRLAQTHLAEGNVAAAKAEYAKVAGWPGAPAHHRWEAAQQIQELDRRQASLPPRDPAANRLRLPALPRPGATFTVAPAGADTNPGTPEKPFATLEQARDAVRALKSQGGLPPGGVSVAIRGGVYHVTQTFRLAAADSGTEEAPVCYAAAPGETPVFSGGVKLKGFQLVKDPAVLARLPAEVRGMMFAADLKANGVTNLWPLRLGGFASGLGFRTHPVTELFFNGQPMPLARWPNDGFLRVAGLPATNAAAAPGATGNGRGRILYEGDRPARWKDDKEILLYGYWFHDWADSYERVATIDPAQHEITLAPPYHTYGYRKGARFYALNLLSETDRPGEWYLDRASSLLYLYPPSNPARADIELSVTPFPFVELQNVSHVRLQGLVWELGSADAVLVRGGDHCVLAGCTVRHCGGNGIEVQGGANHVLLSCDVGSLGRGGVAVSGGNRRTLAPGGHVVENCHIYELSRVDHTYTPAILVSGVGHRIAHNLLHDVGSSALRLGGNEHLVEFNEICRVVLESDDQGGVDMWGDPTFRGNVYRFNYFHHIGNWQNPRVGPDCGQAGIRLDDAICGQVIYGNIFRRCAAGKLGFGGVQIHGGKENMLDNNLFADCATAVSFSPWNQAHWRDFTKNALGSREIDVALYQARYPELARPDEGLNINHLWRNQLLNCGEFLRRNGGGARLFDNSVARDNPGFADPARGDFRWTGPSPSLDRSGFRPIPFEEIGLYRDPWRPALPDKWIQRLRENGAPGGNPGGFLNGGSSPSGRNEAVKFRPE
jgi:hypothetical protein